MRRQLSPVDMFLFSSLFLFVFLAAVTVNLSLNGALLDAVRGAVSDAETSLDLRIQYRRFAFASPFSAELRGIEVRAAGHTNRTLLASADRVRVGVNLFDLLFTGRGAAECVETVEVNGPVLHLRAGAAFPVRGTNGVVVTGDVGGAPSSPAAPPRLNLRLTASDGAVRWYGDERGGETAPVAVARLNLAEVDWREGRGHFKLECAFLAVPGVDLVKTGFAVAGVYDVERRFLEALCTLQAPALAGIQLPELRFRVAADERGLTVDSRAFEQALYVDGAWRWAGGTNAASRGAFTLALGEDPRFFAEVVARNMPRGGDGAFFAADGAYRPSGKMDLALEGGRLRLAGDFLVRDRDGNAAFNLRCHGDERRLVIDRFLLARAPRLATFSGTWDYERPLPDLDGRLVLVRLGGATVSGAVALAGAGGDEYRLALGGINVNGSWLGQFSSYLALRPEGVRVDTRGMNAGLNAEGVIRRNLDMDLRLRLGGYNVGTLANALGAGPPWFDRVLTGAVTLLVVDGAVESSGNLRVASTANPADYYALDYAWGGGELSVRSAVLARLGISLAGKARFDEGRIGLDLWANYGGAGYPVRGEIGVGQGAQTVALSVGGALAVRGRLAGGGFTGDATLDGFSLAPFGVAMAARGYLEVRAGETVETSLAGTLALVPLDGAGFLRRIDLAFAAAGEQLDLRHVGISSADGRLDGWGKINVGGGGVRGTVSFGANASVWFNYGQGQVVARAAFDRFRVSSLLPEGVKGLLSGELSVQGPLASPALAARLRLVDGMLYSDPLAFDLAVRRQPGGFAIEGGSLTLGGLSLVLAGGGLTGDASGEQRFALAAALLYKSGLLRVQGQLDVRGTREGGRLDVAVGLADARVNEKRLAYTASQVKLGDGMLQFVRGGPTGVMGFYDLRKDEFSFKVYENNALAFEAAGETGGERVNVYAASPHLQLDWMNFFPQLFKNATGEGSFRVQVTGAKADPQVAGELSVRGGRFETPLLRKPVTGFALEVRFEGSRVRVPTLHGEVGKGRFDVEGQCYLRRGSLEDLDFRFRTDRETGLDMNVDDSELKARGQVFADLFIKGSPDAPDVQGRVALKNNEIMYMDDGSPTKTEAWIKRVNWHLDVTALENVKSEHAIFTAFIKPQSGVSLRGRLRDSNRGFMLTGRLDVTRGAFDYISYEFKIEDPTFLELKKLGNGFDPRLTFKGSYKTKDSNQETVTVYLTFSGSLREGIKPVFSSDPPRREDEIMALLGVETMKDDTLAKAGQDPVGRYKSLDAVTSLGIFKPLSKAARQFFNLDVVSIRSPIVGNFLEKQYLDSFDPRRQLNILRDTQFTLGKNLTSFMFLEYTLSLKESDAALGVLSMTHQIGLELSFDFLNIGVLVKPTEKSRFTEYEQSLELRFNRKF